MKLDRHPGDSAVQELRWQNLDWSTKSYVKDSSLELQPSTWVNLLELPNPYSFHQALLLCQISQNEWVAWIPDHGEAVLHTSLFCL
ncbi:MAG: hypothetical protein VKL59_02965 [Nostocaceae cyanobacterium]|nr:hypothetical protein [Nostocaceae cyanobacterium]